VALADRPRPTLSAVLFDLDGTLVDTAPDMIAALNRLRGEEGMEPIAYEHLRAFVSRGAAALVENGMPGRDAPTLEQWRVRFLSLYAQHLCESSTLFDGARALIENTLAKLPWGIVTNKPGHLTRPLVAALGLKPHCLLSGDCLPRRKPHPDTLLEASRRLGLAPAACIYVGDAQRDIEAGQRAGMKTVVAAYGYIGEDEALESWGADAVIGQLSELPRVLEQLSA